MERVSSFCCSWGYMFLRISIFVLALCVVIPASADDVNSTANVEATSPVIVPPIPPIQTSTAVPTPTPIISNDMMYIAPTYADILRTLVRFNAIDLSDDNIIDDYAKVTDCEIYQYFFKDDFKWNEIRKKMRASADLNRGTYPLHYYYVAGLKLDRYDFQKQLYRFTESSTVNNVNLFTLYHMVEQPCHDEDIKYIPKDFQALADTPLSLSGLPLSPADAEAILKQMDGDKNQSRIVMARFNMTITFVEPLHKEVTDKNAKSKAIFYFQVIGPEAKPTKDFRLDAHLDSVSFYEDAAMKKLIYTVKP